MAKRRGVGHSPGRGGSQRKAGGARARGSNRSPRAAGSRPAGRLRKHAAATTAVEASVGSAPNRAEGAERPDSPRRAEVTKEDQRPDTRSAAPPFLIAAVGASAGGLVAFSALLRDIPANAPLALVLVQHLAPDHRSLLPDLLGAATKLHVENGRDDLEIRPGHVYVIPPNTHMTVLDGHLRIRPRPQRRSSVEGPVDALFRSVASEYKERAVGVVLSGSANDGAAGIREIKEAGGITIVQAPEEAEIDGMPRAAIATGAVDAVLPVAEIAQHLLRLAEHPFFSRPGGLDVELERPSAVTERRRIFHMLRRTTGVDFNKYKTPTIARRIQRRMALLRLASLEDYAAVIARDPKELKVLQEDLLIHVTSFFREADAFAALARAALPRALEDRRDEPFRIWVPGCSTGEEVYSLAITLTEAFEEGADASAAPPLQIFGTDVSEATIDRARGGIYPPTIAADVSAERLRRFFTPFDGGLRINKAVRDCCVFARQDVTRDPPFSKLDLIVCRNLLIYLTPQTQRKVMAIFHYALKPDGILMLGRSETVGSNTDLFAVLDKKSQLYLRKPGRVRPDIEFAAPPQFEGRSSSARLGEAKSIGHASANANANGADPQAEVNRFLLDNYVPPSVIVDTNLRIARSRGGTSPYLELPTGDVSLDILKMARPQLLSGLRSILQEARTRGQPASRDGIRLKVGGVSRLVNLRAVPIGSPERRQFLVLFEEPKINGHRGTAGRPRRRQPPTPAVVSELEQELAETRRQLQAIIDDLAATNEELQTANEEILSSNEELQSTNEELDTAKEELQSTNEELSTLNDELHGRNEELIHVNGDLVNLLASVQIPIVMVSRDLRIRRFTPAAEKTLNIIPSDVGRPIGQLKPTFSSPDLESLIIDVLETGATREREVETRDGRLLTLQVRPYQTVENQIDGALLVLFDISAAREQAAALKVARSTVEAVASTVREPILQLDDQLRVQRTNRAFCEQFQISASDAEGRSVYEIGDGEWDIPGLRRLIEEVLPKKKSAEAYFVEHEFRRVGRKKILIDARRIDTDTQGAGLTLLAIRNAGERDA